MPPTRGHKLNTTDRAIAILEQVLNTTLVEPEAQEKERLQDLSKEELIEQLLKAKVSHSASKWALSSLTPRGISEHGCKRHYFGII